MKIEKLSDWGSFAVSELNNVNEIIYDGRDLLNQEAWTPVENGTPKKTCEYWVTVEDPNGFRFVKEDLFYSEANMFRGEFYMNESKIVAWMPETLPVPYREK